MDAPQLEKEEDADMFMLESEKEPKEYNSDLDPTATVLALVEDEYKWSVTEGVSPDIGWEELDSLYERYQSGHFYYKDWNYAYLIQRVWPIYRQCATFAQRKKMGQMITIGGAIAANFEARRDRWRFVDRVTGAWLGKLATTYLMLLEARSAWGPYQWSPNERKSGPGNNLLEAYHSALSWQKLVGHIRANTPIWTEMKAPPRLLQGLQLNTYHSWIELIPLDQLMSLLINIGLILSWAGWSPPIARIKKGLRRVFDYLTEEQEEALKVIVGYINANDKWRMRKEVQRERGGRV